MLVLKEEGGGSQPQKSLLSPAIPHSPPTFSCPCPSSSSCQERSIGKVGGARSVPAVKGQMAECGRAVPGSGAGMLRGGGGVALEEPGEARASELSARALPLRLLHPVPPQFNGNSCPNLLPLPSETPGEQQAPGSFWSYVFSQRFTWHVVWLSVIQLWHYLFIGTLNSLLNNLASKDSALGRLWGREAAPLHIASGDLAPRVVGR